MRTRLAAFLIGLASCAPGYAQDCQNPMSPAAFQKGFNLIAAQQTNQKKLDRANDLLKDGCLMAAQVKNIAVLFTEDGHRLEFCEAAYLHTYDRVNFYDVYDAFAAVSFAFRLHDRVAALARGGGAAAPPSAPPPPVAASADPVFPRLAYPPVADYDGRIGCDGPAVTEDVFMHVARGVFGQPTDEAKLVGIQIASEQHCLAFAHVMKLASLVQSENLRLKALVSSFPRVYDQARFAPGAGLFATPQLQSEWLTYAKGYLAPPAPPAKSPCEVSEKDFKGIIKEMADKRFHDEKLAMLHLIAKDRCFSVAQIRAMSQQFPFGEQKLKVFKSLHATCTDPKNYYKLLDELTFASEKDELTRFLKDAGR